MCVCLCMHGLVRDLIHRVHTVHAYNVLIPLFPVISIAVPTFTLEAVSLYQHSSTVGFPDWVTCLFKHTYTHNVVSCRYHTNYNRDSGIGMMRHLFSWNFFLQSNKLKVNELKCEYKPTQPQFKRTTGDYTSCHSMIIPYIKYKYI